MTEIKTPQTKPTITELQTKMDESQYEVYNKPVMNTALDILTILGKKKRVVLHARDDAIPNAVAVANVLTEKFLKGNSKIHDIKVDSESMSEMGKMISTIEIIIVKNS